MFTIRGENPACTFLRCAQTIAGHASALAIDTSNKARVSGALSATAGVLSQQSFSVSPKAKLKIKRNRVTELWYFRMLHVLWNTRDRATSRISALLRNQLTDAYDINNEGQTMTPEIFFVAMLVIAISNLAINIASKRKKK